MRATSFSRTVRVALLVAFGAASVGASAAAAKPRPGRPRAMNLFAASGLFFQVNRQGCGIDNVGQVCVAFAGSPVGGGSFWPKGTPDQYIFNSGLQLAGIVDPALSGFPWAADTIGFLFFNASGGEGGKGLDFVYDRLNPADVAVWPNGAVVRDAAIYHPSLIGLPAISQGDAWTRYWEGDPVLLAGRDHPMGMAVDMRALAWNYPSGNEDIIYFVFTFYNVTALKSSGVYANPTIPAAIQSEIADIGDRFQSANEQVFRISIPDGGYTIKDMFAAFGMDADVANFNANYATAILPFEVGLTYTGDWLPDPGWVFPPDMFGNPFYPAPGFIGVKYLKAPSPLGLTMFSQHFNPNVGFGLLDPNDVRQLYRYLSGFFGPSDTPCSVGSPETARALKLCYLGQVKGDARFFQSSGPFDLPPGEARSIVVAYINAAPVREHVLPFVGGDLPPGVPATGSEIFSDASRVRTIERIAGWVDQSDLNGNFAIEQNEVTTVPRSLLNKALIAQDVFNSRFLLPFAPDAPQFYLVPGDNQVTVVWEKSPTETGGDPYSVVASDNTSALYDPNFRQLDVEGYRIYRGRTSSDIGLVAQFDYTGTVFTDYTGAVSYGDTDGDGLVECAPELGVTGDCPSFPNDIELVGNLIQVPTGKRVQLANGGVIVLEADTAAAGGGHPEQALKNTGVSFVYNDPEVRNSFTYFYAVTAFDVNSLFSGPSSLESARVTKSVRPRRIAKNLVPAGPVAVALLGAAGDTVRGTTPTIDATAGTFNGPAAPTPSFTALATIFADQLLTSGFEATIRIDSVVTRWYHEARYFFTQTVGTNVTQVVLAPGAATALGEEDGTDVQNFEVAVPVNDTALARQAGLAGLPSSAVLKATATVGAVTFTSKDADWHPDVSGSFFAGIALNDDGGSRWYDGTNETAADPTLGLAHGQLTGVTAIYRPVRVRNASNLFRRFDQTTYHYSRAADIRIYWGSTPGTVDSVVDLTHKVPVAFNAQNRASWGIRNDVAGGDDAAPSAADGVLTYNDFLFGACLPGPTGVGQTGCTTRGYQQTATLGNVDVTGDKVSDGQGFAMYINGEPFIFQTATLPSSTTWTYRSYFGAVSKATGSYRFTLKPANPAVPGLRLAVQTTTPATYPATAQVNLESVHTVPDPYYVTSSLEFTANQKLLKLVNLPSQAIIRIYSVSGVLVALVVHNDASGGGEATWNLRNRNNQFVASGVYFYHVETPGGQTKVGRFTIVNFAP